MEDPLLSTSKEVQQEYNKVISDLEALEQQTIYRYWLLETKDSVEDVTAFYSNPKNRERWNLAQNENGFFLLKKDDGSELQIWIMKSIQVVTLGDTDITYILKKTK